MPYEGILDLKWGVFKNDCPRSFYLVYAKILVVLALHLESIGKKNGCLSLENNHSDLYSQASTILCQVGGEEN